MRLIYLKRETVIRIKTTLDYKYNIRKGYINRKTQDQLRKKAGTHKNIRDTHTPVHLEPD